MIVVLGCTGTTGVALVRELVTAGHRVRAGVRDRVRAAGLLGDAGIPSGAVDFVPFDLERPETYAPVLEGGPRCYVALGGPTGTPDLVAHECTLIDAARAAGVAQYVKVSGLDARPTAPSTIQRWHGQIVAHLLGSSVPWTVLEPSFFMQNLLGLSPAIRAGVLPLPAGDGRAAYIDGADIARVAARVLTEDGHTGARYALTGPALLDHHEVAAALSAELQRPVAYHDLPPEAFAASLAQAGLPPWFGALLADVYGTLYRSGAAARVSDDVQRLTGTAPRSLADFLRAHRAAFA